MSTRNTSRLDAGLIARKGEATPAAPPTPVPAVTLASRPRSEFTHPAPVTEGGEDKAAPAPRGLHGTIAVTVRLDPARYERLKVHGARRRRTNQEILVEALDGYLDRHAK